MPREMKDQGCRLSGGTGWGGQRMWGRCGLRHEMVQLEHVTEAPRQVRVPDTQLDRIEN